MYNQNSFVLLTAPKNPFFRRRNFDSTSFSLIFLEFCFHMLYNNWHSVCACSSVDRAPASGAGCVGSIPVRRTKNPFSICRTDFYVYIYYLYSASASTSLSFMFSALRKSLGKGSREKSISYRSQYSVNSLSFCRKAAIVCSAVP